MSWLRWTKAALVAGGAVASETNHNVILNRYAKIYLRYPMLPDKTGSGRGARRSRVRRPPAAGKPCRISVAALTTPPTDAKTSSAAAKSNLIKIVR